MSKYYLCCDLIKNGKKETCYLVYEELEALLKYTSYCLDQNMLINTLTNNDINVGKLIKDNAFDKNNIFYFKKSKEDNETFKVLYKNNDDLLYADYKSIYNLLDKRNMIPYNRNLEHYEKVNEIYKLIEEFITNKNIRKKIIDNFNEKYDSDKFLDYIEFEDYDLAKKIAFVKENIFLTLEYICKDTYKKLVFLSKLKRILHSRLINDKMYEVNKGILKAKLRKKRKDYLYIEENIRNNVARFFNKKISTPTDINVISSDKINEEDLLYRYEMLINSGDIPQDEKEDLMLYIDEQKKVNEKNNKL